MAQGELRYLPTRVPVLGVCMVLCYMPMRFSVPASHMVLCYLPTQYMLLRLILVLRYLHTHRAVLSFCMLLPGPATPANGLYASTGSTFRCCLRTPYAKSGTDLRAAAVRRPSNGVLRDLALNSRLFVTPTAMQPELAVLMANLAHISPGARVLDPCCGYCPPTPYAKSGTELRHAPTSSPERVAPTSGCYADPEPVSAD
eukprot:512015-Rhodomonas_salina.3